MHDFVLESLGGGLTLIDFFCH